MRPIFKTNDTRLKSKYEEALRGLRRNTQTLFEYKRPVLTEGGVYRGIWLECGPLESCVYGIYEPDVALASHRIFFKHQREDGYLNTTVYRDRLLTPGQIQMVVPIAATALETALMTGDEEFLYQAYGCCYRWDNWIAKYRDTRRTGLCELFCEWDTGHDNSPRTRGISSDCPGHDARVLKPTGTLPYLAPDLSASVYGGRVAMAKMANLLNRKDDADLWTRKAEKTRQAIIKYCFDPEDLFFYDLDCEGRFVKIKGDVITRVLGEHVVDQTLFDSIFEKHILNPDEFWTPYPLPSIAINEPSFNRNFERNAWAGACQALTVLRAPRWFNHYGKPAYLTFLMKRWLKAIVESQGFKQQMNPWTGEFFESEGYSPSMCVTLEFISRLYGIRCENGVIEWNCTFPDEDFEYSYSVGTADGNALLNKGVDRSTLILAGKEIVSVNASIRIVTDMKGQILKLVGTDLKTFQIKMFYSDGQIRELAVGPNEEIYF